MKMETEMETVEKTVTLTTLRALVVRVEAARRRLAAAWTAADREFRDVLPSADAELERWRGEWRGFAPGYEAAQLHTQVRKLVVAEHDQREALGAARGVHVEGEAALIAARASVEQTRTAATTPRELAEADELERAARDLAIASAAMEDETTNPASRLAVLAAKGLPQTVSAALRVFQEQRAAHAAARVAEIRKQLEALRAPWPGEAEMVALGAEVEASTGQRLAVPALKWPKDLLAPPQLSDG